MLEPEGTTLHSPREKSPRRVFYDCLSESLRVGGFDQHMTALCKPFLANAAGPSFWTEAPSTYFRILFVGFLEGIEAEEELCWALDESVVFRDFAGFGVTATVPDAPILAKVRGSLLPLLHGEAFDALMRIVEESELLEGKDPRLELALLTAEPLVGIVRRLRSKDHQNYWKRLTRMPGVSRIPRAMPSAPPRSRDLHDDSDLERSSPPFALWLEDLSLARSEFQSLRSRGITDLRLYFAEHESSAIDHVVRACIYGRGPASVRAYLGGVDRAGRELPNQVTPEAIAGCTAIAVALAGGKTQVGVEVPMRFASGDSAVVLIQLAVQPGFEESLGSVLIAYTDVTERVSDRRLRAMVQDAALPIVVETFDGEVIYANDDALEFFQIGREDLAKLRSSDYWEDPEQRASALAILAERGELRSFETRLRIGADHAPRYTLMSARVIERDGRNVILCHHQDTTYSKCSEDEVRAAKQLAEERLHAAEQLAEERLHTAEQLRVAGQRAAEQLATERLHATEQLRATEQLAAERLQASKQLAEERLHVVERLRAAAELAEERLRVAEQRTDELERQTKERVEVLEQRCAEARQRLSTTIEGIRELLDSAASSDGSADT